MFTSNNVYGASEDCELVSVLKWVHTKNKLNDSMEAKYGARILASHFRSMLNLEENTATLAFDSIYVLLLLLQLLVLSIRRICTNSVRLPISCWSSTNSWRHDADTTWANVWTSACYEHVEFKAVVRDQQKSKHLDLLLICLLHCLRKICLNIFKCKKKISNDSREKRLL